MALTSIWIHNAEFIGTQLCVGWMIRNVEIDSNVFVTTEEIDRQQKSLRQMSISASNIWTVKYRTFVCFFREMFRIRVWTELKGPKGRFIQQNWLKSWFNSILNFSPRWWFQLNKKMCLLLLYRTQYKYFTHTRTSPTAAREREWEGEGGRESNVKNKLNNIMAQYLGHRSNLE